MDVFNLPPKSTLVTPNRRLAATLLKKYNQHQLAQGKSSWPTLDILPFHSWIDRLWQEYALVSLTQITKRLSSEEELLVWEEIIRHAPLNDLLLQISGAADIAKSAWGILKQWQVNIDHPTFGLTEDTHVFQQWAYEFQNRCRKHHWLDTHSLVDHLCENIITLPDTLCFVGFTELTPQQKKLADYCKKAGTKIEIQDSIQKIKEFKAYRIRFTEKDQELIAMARWAKSLFDQEPHATIGCIIPKLETRRDDVLRVFTTVFTDAHSYSLDYTHLPFNISAGKSLVTYPIIHMAIELLKLPLAAIQNETFSLILRSPFLGDAETEFSARAEWDHRLRNANHHTFTLSQLLNNAEFHFKKNCPRLASRIEKLLKIDNQILTVSDWTTQWVDMLGILGWPGERTLNSHEYQIVERFMEVLTEFQTYDAILPPMRYQAALPYLKRLLSKIIYQPKTKEAPIQLLGLLEAAGLSFDYAWVMGMDDMTWPEPIKPNPFIPIALQKELLMPHATHARELTYATEITEQLKNGAGTILFSHAEQFEDCELRASRLIVDLPEMTLNELKQSNFTAPAELIFNSRSLESFQDDIAPRINSDEMIRGGVAIFKQQAACPFKAFAEIRLAAYPLRTPTVGLRHLDRGIILHKTLELIWNKINHSDELSKHDDAYLNQFIAEAIHEAINKTIRFIPATSPYITIEKKRLQKIVWDWLQFEKSRPFFTVIARESEYKTQIGSIQFTLRLDRIDELLDGRQLIIDYKTGKYNSPSHWFSARPKEPQLPLYCISDPMNKTGIAYAELQTGSIGLKGISKNNLEIKNIKMIQDIAFADHPDWDQQLNAWKKTFEKLAQDFYEGYAYVDPKDHETCRNCELQPLCRVYESC